jgi:hypothetical protein
MIEDPHQYNFLPHEQKVIKSLDLRRSKKGAAKN